eukprot:Gb_27397 [translate_table: standard]
MYEPPQPLITAVQPHSSTLRQDDEETRKWKASKLTKDDSEVTLKKPKPIVAFKSSTVEQSLCQGAPTIYSVPEDHCVVREFWEITKGRRGLKRQVIPGKDNRMETKGKGKTDCDSCPASSSQRQETKMEARVEVVAPVNKTMKDKGKWQPSSASLGKKMGNTQASILGRALALEIT